jgi:hypothetical protein
MANVWHDAFGNAYPQWAALVRHAGWHPLLVGAGYALAAVLCVANGMASRDDGDGGSAWFVTAALLAAIGANAVARIDLLVIYQLREVARAQGWYEHRRAWQLLALGALAVAALLALRGSRDWLRAAWSRCAAAVLGVALLTGVALVRAVSYHATDRALDLHVLGVSTGRLLEFAGLGLTAACAVRRSRTA